MKKINRSIFVAVIIAIIFSLVGCQSASSDAQADFEKIMDTLKTCDKEAIEDVYGFTEISSFIDKTSGEELRSSIISTLSKMDYKVNSAERVSNTAVKLNVEITTVDFSNIIDNFINKITNLVDSRDYKAMITSMEEEEYKKLMSEKMIEAINEAGSVKVSNTIDVTMTRIDNEWKIGGDSDEFLETLFAGLSKAFNSIV